MSRTRVHNLNISLDGFAAGEHVTLDEPIGGAEQLFARFDGRVIHGVHHTEDPFTIDRALTSLWGQGVGAEIMGRRKFGPQSGPWGDDDWRGWWGDEPPFRTQVFVMTHHAHPPIHFDNGTSFHFIDAPPQEVLGYAKEAANGLDVRLGGGPSTIRQFLHADLVDFMHLVTVPLVLGSGVSLWEGLAGVHQRFDIEVVVAASGQVHQFWNRRTG
ncbi:dihydrofolate reductase [Nakamurella sp. UYEF19]|uniref:dihydrofolate reductase family protein n=1 Tax=Nakamurella sp. UYEF19 TaxID=1756392 RepID=UPI003392B8B7